MRSMQLSAAQEVICGYDVGLGKTIIPINGRVFLLCSFIPSTMHVESDASAHGFASFALLYTNIVFVSALTSVVVF